jgi:hypothetical protein
MLSFHKQYITPTPVLGIIYALTNCFKCQLKLVCVMLKAVQLQFLHVLCVF